jgi:predicted SAM-dependent methyltransferase
MSWKKQHKLHLGCGSNLLSGWVNIDLDSPGSDLHADLTQPLPFVSDSVDFIFTEHFIEHITRPNAVALLKECKRVMRKNAVIRISTPDLNWLVQQYTLSKTDEWADVQWIPNTPCQMINEGMRSWGHQFLYDAPELNEVLHEAGFSSIKSVTYRGSDHDELRNLECRPWHRELIVEAS